MIAVILLTCCSLPLVVSKTTNTIQAAESDTGKLSVYVYVKPSIGQTYVYDATVTVQRIEDGQPVGDIINVPFVTHQSSYEKVIPTGIYALRVSHQSLWPKPYTETIVIEPDQILNKNVGLNRFKSKTLALNLNNILTGKLLSKILFL